MKKTALFLLSIAVLSIGSCGNNGGGGGTTPPSAVSITIDPTAATVPVGSTAQFTATVQNATDTSVTWQVDGTTGGDVNSGFISTDGVYSAPLRMPATGEVTITAVANADTSKSAAATATIVSESAMLSGQFAFSYTGFDSNGLFYAAGSFVADGNGTITDGLLDLNLASGAVPNLTLSGTYTVSPNGRAEILLIDSDDFSYTLRAVLISSDRLHMIQFDNSVGGQGFIEKQDPTAFNNAAFAGNYAIRLNGIGDNNSALGLAGRITADGASNLTGGVTDINENGTATTNAAFDGTYDLTAGNGRGTAVLNTPLGTVDFVIYTVSASKAYLMSLDLVPAFLGTAEKQTLASFSDANFSGDYVFNSSGFSANGFILTAGRLSSGGGAITAGVSDENDQGTLTENLAFTGTYSVTANGRGTGSFTSSAGTSNLAFYLISPSRAVFVQLDSFAVATGELESQQGGPFSAASLSGDYGFSLTGNDSDNVGQFNSDRAGAITGTTDINDPTAGPIPDLPFSGTYTISSNGRGDLTMGDASGSLHFYMYIVSPSKAILVGSDTILLGTAEKQF